MDMIKRLAADIVFAGYYPGEVAERLRAHGYKFDPESTMGIAAVMDEIIADHADEYEDYIGTLIILSLAIKDKVDEEDDGK